MADLTVWTGIALGPLSDEQLESVTPTEHPSFFDYEEALIYEESGAGLKPDSRENIERWWASHRDFRRDVLRCEMHRYGHKYQKSWVVAWMPSVQSPLFGFGSLGELDLEQLAEWEKQGRAAILEYCAKMGLDQIEGFDDLRLGPMAWASYF